MEKAIEGGDFEGRLKPQPIVTIRVRTSVRPFPLQKDWPPKDVGSLLRWQSTLDPSCRRRLEKKLMQRYQSGYQHATVIIDSPVLHYGFFVKFKRPVHRGGRRRSSRQEVYGLPVTELRCIRIDDRYIAERSLPGVAKTLSSLDVVLVGCGTIGGFLAEMLVKAGAGSLGGRLTLVDSDSLGPQNLGRHRLGMPHMFKNKAVQMAAELERLAPGIRIDAKQVDVKTIQLGKPDLLIDATGALVTGIRTPKMYRRRRESTCVSGKSWRSREMTIGRHFRSSLDATLCTLS